MNDDASDGASGTPSGLADTFRRLIRNTGPISLAHYMAECNARYYSSRDPFGTRGDFVTAPEISQMFGELIGLWLADSWVRAGRPDHVHYVELGPGRGTLAKDALRTVARYGLMPVVHFVESSTELREMQLAAVPGAVHHHDLSTVPTDGPIMVVANEFLDALPVRQLIQTAEGWRERMVGLDGDRFVFVVGSQPMDSAVPEDWRRAGQGTLLETSPASATILYEVSGRLNDQGGVALFIDYGAKDKRAGATVQAVRDHRKVDIFSTPGEADLSAHVDFETMANIARVRGAKVSGIETQGDWLRSLGIETRTEALQRRAPHYKDDLAASRDRLIADDQMGVLFKVLGLAAPNWPDGAGFTPEF